MQDNPLELLEHTPPQSSYELLVFLRDLGFLKNPPHFLWWPNAGSFEVHVGTILVQNTKWENAQKVLERLRKNSLLSCEKIANLSQNELLEYMANFGLRVAKSERIIALARAILRDFNTYENYYSAVSREWLLEQKGIGEESADSILCYALLRDEMVADSYSRRLLENFGYEFESYSELKEWLQDGILQNYSKIQKLYIKPVSLNTIYARFHGKIVDFCKQYPKSIKRKKYDD